MGANETRDASLKRGNAIRLARSSLKRSLFADQSLTRLAAVLNEPATADELIPADRREAAPAGWYEGLTVKALILMGYRLGPETLNKMRHHLRPVDPSGQLLEKRLADLTERDRMNVNAGLILARPLTTIQIQRTKHDG